jgi:hypothetical protein
VDVGCALRGRDSEACKSLEGAYDLLRAGINSAQSAIGGYRELGFGLEAVEFAVRRLEESVARLSGDLQEVRDAVTRMVPVPSVGASAAPTGAEPATGAQTDAAVPEVAEGAAREATP